MANKLPGTFELMASTDQPEYRELRLRGCWTIHSQQPEFAALCTQLNRAHSLHLLVVDGAQLTNWDSALITFLLKLDQLAAKTSWELDTSRLPEGVLRLLALATAIPEQKDARPDTDRIPFFAQVGLGTQQLFRDCLGMIRFAGEAVLSFGRLFAGRARFRRVDFGLLLQDCGAQALPIVTLISVLVGLILAFVGAVQLKQFGAEIFVADLVALGTTREMGAMMTAIIMAGRTGAAFAAQLGTMQVNEEIDALHTLGIEPMDFLVLPRMLALVLMVPLLCIYADVLAILGGAAVGIGMLDLSVTQYFHQTQAAVGLVDFSIGIGKGAVFGVLIALSGCLRGMQCGRSSAAVGLAATSAVVTGIVFIICSDSLITVFLTILGI